MTNYSSDSLTNVPKLNIPNMTQSAIKYGNDIIVKNLKYGDRKVDQQQLTLKKKSFQGNKGKYWCRRITIYFSKPYS